MPRLKPRLTISVVLFQNSPEHLAQLCESISACTLKCDVYFLDNSPSDDLSNCIPNQPNFHYQMNNENLGYGRSHNIAINDQLGKGDYHLVINPDVYFTKGTLETIMAFMDQNETVGLLLPRVLNPNGSEQPLFKLLPSPGDLFLRRFLPAFIRVMFTERLEKYRMAFADEKSTFDAPYLSGCFMFMRKEALKEVGAFDERFFLYCEDVDLSRRIRAKWRTTYFSKSTIYHYFFRGSYKYPKLFFYHIISSIKYFNKYGWFEDQERKKINSETLASFTSIEKSVSLSASK